MSPWSDSLHRRGPEDLAFAPTWPCWIRRRATGAR